MSREFRPEPVFTRRDLKNAGCESPGCPHTDHSELYLSPVCHESAGLEAAYIRESGVMRLSCNVCRRFVARIQVAESPDADLARRTQ
jgi:hypothetical protein